jgi:hypothetical protein
MMPRRRLAGPAAALLCLTLALSGVTHLARADSLSSSVLGMFPKNVGEIGYADMRTARKSSWFQQFEGQVLPVRFAHFERYVIGSGLDLEKQVEEIAWAVAAPSPEPPTGSAAAGAPPAAPQKFTGEEVVGIARGSFTPDVIDAFFKQQKLPTVTVRGYTLYAFGSGMSPGDLYFFFLDSNTVAFGHREPLEALIGVRFGDEESFLQNDTLSALVDEVNGQGTMWAALDKRYAQTAINRLMPDVAQFPGATTMLARVAGMTIAVNTDPGVDAQITPHCASTDDALTLAQLLQAGLLFKSYQVKQYNPDLARALDATSVSADGNNLKIRTQISDDLLLSLLRSNSFAFQM